MREAGTEQCYEETHRAAEGNARLSIWPFVQLNHPSFSHGNYVTVALRAPEMEGKVIWTFAHYERGVVSKICAGDRYPGVFGNLSPLQVYPPQHCLGGVSSHGILVQTLSENSSPYLIHPE